MKLIVGLGNPGKEYVGTRHNVGFSLVERLASQWHIDLGRKKFSSFTGDGVVEGQKVILLLPQTFMNLSGGAVLQAVQFFGGPELLVVHDDLDLALGRVKLDFGRGAAGHRGVSSIMESVGKDFSRVRLGIGRPERKEQVESFVLSAFGSEEMLQVAPMVDEGIRVVHQWLSD